MTILTFEELKEKTKDAQTDKDGKLVQLYASNVDEQHAYIEAAKAKGYTVLYSSTLQLLVTFYKSSRQAKKISALQESMLTKSINLL